ncbi:MAG: hypothetical protein RSE54_10375 [Ruthenibacterium sp.]
MILEYIGRYYDPIAQMLYDAGIFVSAVNLLCIKEYGNILLWIRFVTNLK